MKRIFIVRMTDRKIGMTRTLMQTMMMQEGTGKIMHTNKNGITLKECPICGSEVTIDAGSIVCGCGIELRIRNINRELQNWVDLHLNDRYCDSDKNKSKKIYKIMCWDSIDSKLNIFGIKTYNEAVAMLKELEKKHPGYTFQIFED